MRHESWNLTGSKDPQPDATASHRVLADEFDAWAEAGRGESMERGHLPTAGQALSRIDFGVVRVFLDLGTGNGFAVRHAAARMPSSGVAFGIDVSPKMVAVARRTTKEWQARRAREDLPTAECEFLEARFDRLPIPDTSVDAAFSNEAIYYAPDVGAALRSVLRVLKPGARFHCSLDYYEENTYSHDWQEKVGVPMIRASEEGWRQHFQDAGFEDVTTDRLLDDAPIEPLPPDADAAARERHDALVAWKTKTGTLLVVGRRPE